MPMSERLGEPELLRTTSPPVEPSRELARKNMLLGIALFVLALAIAGGAVGVSFIYLHFD
jgi:hypothetical protein